MKKCTFLFCCLALLMTACSDDDDAVKRLSLDGPNLTGPLLQTAIWEAGVRFTPSETQEFTGLRLTQVQLFMGDVPNRAEVNIYGPGVDNNPGILLYTAIITNSIFPTEWNTHRIARPINITGEELWITVELEHQLTQQSIGCDAGPAVTNGDWLFSSLDGQWRTFRDRTGESINWNIRGIVEE